MLKAFGHGFMFVIGAAVGIVAIKMLMDNASIVKDLADAASETVLGNKQSGAEWEVL